MDHRFTRTATFPTYSITPACNCSRVRKVTSLYCEDLIHPIDGRQTERGWPLHLGRNRNLAEVSQSENYGSSRG